MNDTKKTRSDNENLGEEIRSIVDCIKHSGIPYKAIHLVKDGFGPFVQVAYENENDPTDGYLVDEPLAPDVPYLLIALNVEHSPSGFLTDIHK